MNTTTWTCKCGQVALTVAPEGGTRAVCYCTSCRGFATRLGASDILDECGGSVSHFLAETAGLKTRSAEERM